MGFLRILSFLVASLFAPSSTAAAQSVASEREPFTISPAAAGRIQQAMALGDATNASSATALIAMLDDPDNQVRTQAAASLARLGEVAFPAMVAALDAPEQSVETDLRFGNPGRPPLRVDYLAYAFINSRSDPGPSLLAWARNSLGEEVGQAKLLYFSVVLGLRGDRSLPLALDLLADGDARIETAAVRMIGHIGPDAAAAATPLVEWAFRQGSEGEYAIQALARLGWAGEPQLFRIFSDHPSEDLRVWASQYIDADPAFIDRQLDILARAPTRVKRAAILLLARHPVLPARAVRLLADHVDHGESAYWALVALGRTEPSNDSAAVAEKLVSQLADGADDLDRMLFDHGGLIAISLVTIGSPGIEALERAVTRPETRRRACAAVIKAAPYTEIESLPLRPGVTEVLRALEQRQCAGLREAEPEDEPEWPAGAVNSANAGTAAEYLSRGSYATADMERACGQSTEAIEREDALRQAIAGLSWERLAVVARNCDALFTLPVSLLILDRIGRDPGSFEAWASEPGSWSYDLLGGLEVLRNDPALGRSKPLLLQLARSGAQGVRRWAISLLSSSAPDDPAVMAAIVAAMADPDPLNARAAAEAIIAIGPDTPHWSSAMERLLVLGVEADVAVFLENNIDELRPPEYQLTSGRSSNLPPFPWPPPRYASILTFGRDVERALLGRPEETLDVIHTRIVRALASINTGYESGLFGVPGGFALLTKIEQTDADGRPLAGRDRWRDVRPPPASLSDFFVRLFLAPPGYYRAIAFVFTDQMNFGYGTGSLPDFRRGGRVLPPELARAPYSSRQAYVLIYAFQRRDTGSAQPYTQLSAHQHLQQTGFLQRLDTSR